MFKRFLTIIVATLASITLASAETASDVPAIKGRVNDYANVLSPSEESKLEEKLAAIERLPDNPQVAILIVSDIDGKSIDDYAISVARKWGVGQKGKDNGILITVVTDPNNPDAFKRRIDIGYGLEGIIPDIKAEAIYTETMRPHLKEPGKENFFAAFSGATDAIHALLSDGKTGNDLIDNPSDSDNFVAVGFVILFVCGLIAAIHWSVGIGVGTIAGAVVAVTQSLSAPFLIMAMIAGAFLGFILHFVARAMIEAESSGGYSGGGYSGGGRSGGFGGGGFGGGGASGGR